MSCQAHLCFSQVDIESTLAYCEPSGVPLELLQGEWWVPGMTLRSEASKYAGKQQFKEILQTSGESSILFISRLIKDTAYAAVVLHVG